MTCLLFLLLPLLLLHQVSSKELVTVFKGENTAIAMGDCFGADYFVAYRSAPGGLQLIANFSENSSAVVPPADLQGRMLVQQRADLLGLHIHNLTKLDSRIYVSECWKDGEPATNISEQVLVCQQQADPVEPRVNADGRTELQCNTLTIGGTGFFLHWYWETFPTYTPTLFLDSSVSLEPLVEEFKGALEVRKNATTLLLNNTILGSNPKFYCVVLRDTDCLSFQYFDHEDIPETWSLFVSPGEAVVLGCPVHGSQQTWETPLGDFSSIHTGSSDVYLSPEESNFSLIIPHVGEHHGGKYQCLSSLLHREYILFYCPSKKSHTKTADLGGNISLECNHGEGESARILWERQALTGHYELIWEMDLDHIPEDLKGRLQVMGAGHMLHITDVKANDSLEYRCVVLADAEYEDTLEQYVEYDYTEEEVMCLFKGEITVNRRDVPAYMVGIIVAVVIVAVAAVVTVVIITKKRLSAKKKCPETTPNPVY